MLNKTVIALGFLVLCSFLAQAQDPIGTLEGQITDPSSALVSGAEVSVHNSETGLTRTVHSSRDGSYHISNLPVGEYSLTVAASGFAPYSQSPIRIDIGQVVTFPVALLVSGGHSDINVDAQTAMVDTSRPSAMWFPRPRQPICL